MMTTEMTPTPYDSALDLRHPYSGPDVPDMLSARIGYLRAMQDMAPLRESHKTLTPEQIATYFNTEWFERQLEAVVDSRFGIGYLSSVNIGKIARHLAGNLAQAAMGLEKEAANG